MAGKSRSSSFKPYAIEHLEEKLGGTLVEIIRQFPHEIEHVEHFEIPIDANHHLGARMWLPSSAQDVPVPALLEYIPYRKRDMTRARDALTHPYLAGHGYASVRVDMRGSGESTGILRDQYRPQELEDAVTAIRWLASQPWCDGNVGMFGISWGGFNALQVASLRPSELKAIITACSTDDLYVDNMHYMGGCLLTDNLSEATTMFSVNSCPPDPRLVGNRWREMWMERLRESGLWLDTWLQHQRRDSYWKHGSVCENYEAIQCPVMAIGGWADGYTNAVFRLLEHLRVPRLGLLGPWGHKYPHTGIPGPAIGFLQEALRWWDFWLKGSDTGIMDEPMLRAWIQDSTSPTTYYHQRPGSWAAEEQWPSDSIQPKSCPLAAGRILLHRNEGPDDPRQVQTVQSPLSVGLFAGKWCSYSSAPDLPHDQREEDGGALVFQSEPLSEPLEILGAPVLRVKFASSEPVAMIAVRLGDVAENDEVTRVTFGLLNLTHLDGHEHPHRLTPGEFREARVPMNHIGQRFPAGHRLRLSISTSYWPLAWPPPKPVRLSILPHDSSIELPTRKPRTEDSSVQFAAPQSAPPIQVATVEPTHHNWLVHRDLAQDLSTQEVIKDEGIRRIEEIDLEVGNRTWNWYTYQGADFESPRGETQTERIFGYPNHDLRTTTRTVLTCTSENFYIAAELDAWEDSRRVFSENWQHVIPRDHM